MERSSVASSLLIAAALLLSPVHAAAQMSEGSLEAFAERRPAIGDDRLSFDHRQCTALPRDLQPTQGWALHAVDQYDDTLTRPAARKVFGFAAPVAVEAVVAQGPAARTGIAGRCAGRDRPVPPLSGPGKGQGSATRDAGARPESRRSLQDQAVSVTIRHQGTDRTVTIPASPRLPLGIRVLLGPGMAATSDGRTVQVRRAIFERYDDEQGSGDRRARTGP